MSRGEVHVHRVYDTQAAGPARRHDDLRVLVDRVWPRGVRKDELDLDEWVKAIAPSTELRKWFGHDPERFAEFRRRYRDELTDPAAREVLDRLRTTLAQRTLTLLTATKDTDHSHAAVLADVLREQP